MQLVQVTNEQTAQQFLELPLKLYKDDPNWIRPLDADITKVFDEKRNKFFKHGKLARWILLDDKGKVIGRVAAFINESKAFEFEQPTGCMGFFDCINDQAAANMLFDKCQEWNTENGMEAMDGPVNFGERNQWWGLLVEGFDEPCYGMNYNPPHYIDLFKNFGFKLYFNQYSYGLGMNVPRPEKYYERSRELMKDPNYTWSHITKEGMLTKYTQDFQTVYNKAFGGREGVKPITIEQARNLITALKPVLVDYLLWFGYYKGEPIALFFMMPELNQYFKHVNGKVDWLGKLKIGWHTLTKTNRKVFAFLFGVIPEFQGKGVEGGIIIGANNVVQPKKRWDELELTWIGDFNPKMMRVAENLGAKVVKTHVTYRKLFDPKKPFHRKPFESGHEADGE